MKCPTCGNTLHPVQTKAYYDLVIVVNQCANCGGIWFDKDEYYRIPHSEALKLDPLDESKLQEAHPLPEICCCPIDLLPLQPFSDISLPKNIDIEHCPKCFGYWFNRGEFRSLKEHVQKKNTTPLDPKLSKELDRYFQSQFKSKDYDWVVNLSKTLMQPYYKHTRDEDIASSFLYALPTIIIALIRLLLNLYIK